MATVRADVGKSGDFVQRESIARVFRTFIQAHFPVVKKRGLRDEDFLLTSGIIDSLGVLDIVSFMEAEFTVNVADEELIPENFQSIDRMAAFVVRKQSGEL